MVSAKDLAKKADWFSRSLNPAGAIASTDRNTSEISNWISQDERVARPSPTNSKWSSRKIPFGLDCLWVIILP